MNRLIATLTLAVMFSGMLILGSCQENQNDNTKNKHTIENTGDETHDNEKEALEEAKKEYPNAPDSLKEQLEKTEKSLKQTKETAKKATKDNNRVEAQKMEEKRKKIQKEINEIKNEMKKFEEEK